MKKVLIRRAAGTCRWLRWPLAAAGPQDRFRYERPGQSKRAQTTRAKQSLDAPVRSESAGDVEPVAPARIRGRFKVPVHIVAARLGHADPAVTLRVYSHVLREHAVGIGDAFAQAVKASVSKSVSKQAQEN